MRFQRLPQRIRLQHGNACSPTLSKAPKLVKAFYFVADNNTAIFVLRFYLLRWVVQLALEVPSLVWLHEQPHFVDHIPTKMPEPVAEIEFRVKGFVGQCQTSGLKLMMDLLHRSRLRLSGIGLGFIRRMLDEAVCHCQQRFVGGKSLLAYDQVQHRISLLQAWFTIASAMCHYTAKVSSLSTDLTSYGLQANSAKAILTDMMQDSAQSLLQLTGAKGYRRDHIAGRSVADSRPFQIFEGSNDVMYSQVADIVLKKMKDGKYRNFYNYLSQFELTTKAAERFREVLNYNLDFSSVQRIRVMLGKVIARLITADITIDLYETDFRQDLVDNALEVIGNDIATQMPALTHARLIQVVEGYRDQSDWKQFFSS